MIKSFNKRALSIIMAGITLVSVPTFTSCKKETKKEEIETTTYISYELEENMVDSTISKINSLNLLIEDDEIVKDSALMLLLSELAKEDENGKISADTLNHFKSIVNENEMIDKYDTLLNKVENAMLDGKFVSISSVLPSELSKEQQILSSIENIAKRALDNENNKEIVMNSFNKMYTLFVEEKEVDGFEVRDLSYSLRSAASAYAREVIYLARNYASQDKIDEMDKRTNDQNAKSYMVNILGKISNQIVEESEDKFVVERFNTMYDKFHEIIMPIVNSKSESEKDLVNYINLDYLENKVATKDRRELVGEYNAEKVRNVLDLIDAITKDYQIKYGKDGQNANVFGMEQLLVGNNKYDTLALKYVQSNSAMLLNSINENTTYDDLRINPYYDNLTKYLTKLEDNGSKGFVHKYIDENGKEVEETILWQNVSNGVHVVCDEIIRYTLSIVRGKGSLSENQIYNTYYDKAVSNSVETVQYLQNTIYGECEKVDAKEYFLK